MTEALQIDVQDDGEPPSSGSFDYDAVAERRPWDMRTRGLDDILGYTQMIFRHSQEQTAADVANDIVALSLAAFRRAEAERAAMAVEQSAAVVAPTRRVSFGRKITAFLARRDPRRIFVVQ